MSYQPHQETPLSAKGYFDDNAQRYRLCCCHVRTWGLVIGILELIGIVLQVIGSIVSYAMGNSRNSDNYAANTPGALAGGIIGFILWVIAVALLLVGIKKEKHLYLIFHLVLQILSIIGCIIYAIIFFVAVGTVSTIAYNGNNQNARYAENAAVGAGIGFGVVLLIVAAVEIFFFYAIFRCYKYLKEKRLATDAASYTPMATSYAAVEKGH